MKMTFKKILALMLVLMLVNAELAVLAETVLALPEGLKVIEEEAFYGDTSIEKVVVPEGATEIGSKAFADSSLAEIELPDTLETIADDSFDGCTDLTITAPEDSYAYDWAVEKGYIEEVQESPVEDFEYTIDINKVTITGYTGNDAAVVVPNTINNYPVTSIGEEAFFGYTSLTSIVIPDSITSIGSTAKEFFRWVDAVCTDLAGINVDNEVRYMAGLRTSFGKEFVDKHLPIEPSVQTRIPAPSVRPTKPWRAN